MKKLICFLSFITMLCVVGCSEDFTTDEYGTQQTKSSDTSRFLDISTTNITEMTEADFQTLSAAMERLEVEKNNGYLVIGRTDYRKLNMSKRAYWMIKQACENGNRIVASVHQSSTFPLIKNRNSEGGNGPVGSDCVAYAVHGLDYNLDSALLYIHTNYPNGVLSTEMETVVKHFFSTAYEGTLPSVSGWISPSIVYYKETATDGHAVNGIYYDAGNNNLWCRDKRTGGDVIVSGSDEFLGIIYKY